MGMELGMAVEESFGVKFSVMALAEGATVVSLAKRIVDSIMTGDGEGALQDVQDVASGMAARHGVEDEANALKQEAAATDATLADPATARLH